MPLILSAIGILLTITAYLLIRVLAEEPAEGAAIGNAGKERVLAFMVDNAVALVLALAIVKLLPVKTPLVSGSGMSVTYLGYFFFGEAFWGRTPGKALAGLNVVMLDGRPCTMGAAAVRTAARLLEANPIVLGALPAGIAVLCTPCKQRLGDVIAHTIVVKRLPRQSISATC